MPRNSKDNSLYRYKAMVKICEKYQMYLAYPRARIVMRSETKAKVRSAVHYVRAFKDALSRLEPKYIELIKYEFLNDHKTYWWKLKYSQATFYRLRDKSIKSFIEEFSL